MSRTLFTSALFAGLVAFAPSFAANASESREDWAVKAREQIIEKNY